MRLINRRPDRGTLLLLAILPFALTLAAYGLGSAVRLETAGVGTARAWLAMQTAYDLAEERTRDHGKVSALVARQGVVTQEIDT